MIVKVEGFVANTTDCGESDKMLTLITRRYGKLSVYARGSRKLTSKFMTASLKFSYGDYVITKTEKNCILNEASTKMTFFGLQRDVESLALADYIAEVTADVIMPEEPEDQILELALNSIYLLSQQKKPPKTVKTAFETRLMSYLGLFPHLDCCQKCGKNEDGTYYLDIMDGTVTCSKCAEKSAAEAPVPQEEGKAYIVAVLSKEAKDFMKRTAECEKTKIFANPPDTILRQICAASEKYLVNQLEKNYKTLDFYKEIAD